MSRLFRSGAAMNLGIGIALVLSVAFLTVMFSFLGTFGAGAMIGMMMGAGGRWRWKTLLVSLVFPAIMLVYSHVLKADLASKQSVLLSVFSFGIFWLTYLPTFAVVHFEGQGKDRTGKPAAQEAATISPGVSAADGVEAGPRAPPAGPRVESPREPGLAELQGRWQCEIVARDGHAYRKVVEVERHELALSVLDSQGRVCFRSKGEVSLGKMGPFRLLKVVGPESAPSMVSAEQPGSSWIWVYRVAGPTLRVAVNFEETAGDPNPAVETCIKQPESAGV